MQASAAAAGSPVVGCSPLPQAGLAQQLAWCVQNHISYVVLDYLFKLQLELELEERICTAAIIN